MKDRRRFPKLALVVGLLIGVISLAWALTGGSASSAQQLGPAAASTPDAGGYYWSTVQIDWRDATGGTVIPNFQVVGEQPVPIGFTFPYYSEAYTELYVSLNGILGLNQRLGDLGNCPEYEGGGRRLIVPLSIVGGYNYDLSNYDRIRYLTGGTAPDRYFIVEWQNMLIDPAYVEPGDSGVVGTFEAVLFENGDFQFNYLSLRDLSMVPAAAGTKGVAVGSSPTGQSSYCPGVSPISQVPASGGAVRFHRSGNLPPPTPTTGPSLTSNFNDGGPGSYFAVTGSGYPANSTATVYVNDHALVPSLLTDGSGSVTYQLSTTNADLGRYVVRTTVNPTAETVILLAAGQPIRPQTGGGTVLAVPAGIALPPNVNLPSIRR